MGRGCGRYWGWMVRTGMMEDDGEDDGFVR
jgi:hypothetical protein